MLDSLRNMGRSWVAKVLIGILIVSVAAFGIPSVFLDLSANTVARVGDRDIGAREFERYYRNQLNQVGSQIGQVPTPAQSVQFGIPGAALNELASQAVLAELAETLDLGASDDKLAQLVRADPSFAGTLGVFDRNQFTQTLLNSGLTESEYLTIQREVAYQEQIAAALFESVSAPQPSLALANRYQNDLRTISTVELDPLLFAVTDEPSDEELAQFFTENQAQYSTEEIRNIDVLVLTPQSLAAGIEVSDEAIAARYERDLASYSRPEQRAVAQVILDADTRAAFEAALDAGDGFGAAADAAGVSDAITELSLRPQSDYTDADLAEAAFGLAPNEVTIIPGPLGDRAITVTEIAAAETTSLEDARDAIANDLAVAEAQGILLDAYDAIEEARAAFQPINGPAEEFGLEVYPVALTRSGAQLGDIAVLPPASIPNVAQRVFATAENVNVTPAISLGGNSAVFFTLGSIEPVRDRTLEEARDEVVADWQALEARNRMTAAAEEVVAAVDGGTSFEAAVAELNQVPQTSAPFRRAGPEDGTLAQEVIAAAFAGGEGYATYVPTQSGTVVVLQVTDAQSAEGEIDTETAQVFNESLTNNLYGSMMDNMITQGGLRVNQATLNTIIGLEQP